MRGIIHSQKMILLAVAAFLFIGSVGCKKENASAGPDFIAPAEVERINDMNYFKKVRMGAQSNAEIGSCINLQNGYVYEIIKAGAVQEQIDLVLVNGSTSSMNLITPASSRFNAWGTSTPQRKYIYDRWWVRNLATVMSLPTPSPDEQALFDNAHSVDDIIAAYNTVSESITRRNGYSPTNDGPGSHVRKVGADNILVFRSEVRRTVAIMKVDFVEDGTDGMMQLQIKSGTF